MLFHHENETCKKKNSDNCFEVKMGGYNGVEVFELVGTLVLSALANNTRNKIAVYIDRMA